MSKFGKSATSVQLIAATTVAALLTAGGGALAYAADGSANPPAAATIGRRQGPGGQPGRRGLLRGALATAAKTIGVDTKTLVDAIRKDHQTVAQVAKAHNVDPATVVDALVKTGIERIDAAVAAGKLDADRATRIKERLPKVADRLVNRTGERRGRQGRAGHRHRLLRGALATAAKTIGVDTKTLVDAIRKDHQTVAQVAKAHNVDPATVVDALVKTGTERIDAAVAAGKLDADRATKIKERLPKVADRLVNRTGERRGGAGGSNQPTQ